MKIRVLKFLSPVPFMLLSLGVSAAETFYHNQWIQRSDGNTTKVKTMDASGWHVCGSNQTGGSCGSRSISTGKSGCKSVSVSAGTSFSLNGFNIAGLSFDGGYSSSWSACNTRSETITCSPDKGYKGRAQIMMRIRYGQKKYKRSGGYYRKGGTCDVGYVRDTVNGLPMCVASGRWVYVSGYWPYQRYSTCWYQAL